MADHMDVKTKEGEADALSSPCVSENAHTCKICLTAEAKYTCPRCNMGYCSVTCYQNEKHASCSEAFYKDCVVNELKEMTNSSEDRQKVLEMLTKDLEEKAKEDSDQEEDDDLGERLQGLDLDKDISSVWSRLSHKEKEEFARMLQDGRLAGLIEMWTPWWKCKKNTKLVQEQAQDENDQSSRDRMPDILPDITDINTLLKNSRPSSDCRFDMVNILFGYCFVTRLHNGCHLECPVDSSQDLLESCCVLRNQVTCGSVGEAIQKALDDVSKKGTSSEGSSQKFNLSIIEDIKVIISGPGQGNTISFMSAAMSDLVVLMRNSLQVVKKELKSQRRTGQEESEDLKSLKSKVFKSEKKILFLLSWLQRYGMAMHQILPLLQFEIESRQSEREEVEEFKTVIETNMDKLKPSEDKQKVAEETTHKKIVELS